MSCNQRSFIARMAVDDPAALQSPLWRDHLSNCEECRKENAALGKSLAIYRHLEKRQDSNTTVDGAWSQFEQCLSGVPRPRKGVMRIMIPATAAAGLLLAIMTGTIFLNSPTPIEVQPPQAVNLKPDERMHLQRVLRRSLVENTIQTHSDPETAARRVTPSFPVSLGQRGVVPGTTFLAPSSAMQDGRSPVILFRTLRKLRTKDELERFRTSEPIPAQTPVSAVGAVPIPSFDR